MRSKMSVFTCPHSLASDPLRGLGPPKRQKGNGSGLGNLREEGLQDPLAQHPDNDEEHVLNIRSLAW